MNRLEQKQQKRIQRKRRIRKKIHGTSDRPRLTVFKSLKNISVQAIDDQNGRTIASISTLEKEFSGVKRSVEGAKVIGGKMAERLLKANVSSVVFDRNGYQYHGIVQAFAEGARESGLKL